MMKTLMLNPPYVDDFCRSARWATKSRGRVQRHPDWMLIAAAVLEKAGCAVKFIDGAALNLKRDEVEQEILAFKPELTVVHTTTPSIYNDIEYARLAKEHTACTTVLIGPHVTAVPDNTFEIASEGVDIIARGEYDYTLRDIAGGKRIEDIEGISYRKHEEIIHTKARGYLDVNELPFPAWHHVKPEWYRDAGKRFPFLTLISGRGCVGRCTFCRDVPLMYGRKPRIRDPRLVVDEMVHDLELFPYLKEIMFETDTFSMSPPHVRGVCEEILKRGMKITWSCNVRVDIDLKLLPLMRRAGCRMLMVGFEFGTQESLDAVKKGIRLEQSRAFARAAHKLGFTIHGCFMFGAPGETREMARKTIDFAKSLPMDTVQFSGICVYPGTEMYGWAREHGYLIPGDWKEWVSSQYEQATLLSYPQLSKEEIDAFIDKGLKEFYFRPGQVWRMLWKIRTVSDLRRKLFGFKKFYEYLRA